MYQMKRAAMLGERGNDARAVRALGEIAVGVVARVVFVLVPSFGWAFVIWRTAVRASTVESMRRGYAHKFIPKNIRLVIL